MSRLSRLRAAALGFLLVMSAVPTVAAAQPADDDLPWVAGLARSHNLHGPVLAEGMVLDKKGRGTRGHVLAVVWPTFADLGNLKTGDRVFRPRIAQAASAKDGRFQLKVDPKVPLGAYTEADGTINIDVYAAGADGISITSLSRQLAKGSNRWREPKGSVAEDDSSVQLVLGAAGGPLPDAVPMPLPAADKDPLCGDPIVATYDSTVVGLGETYPGPHATAKFKYVNSATSSLGIGWSVNGGAGSWSQSSTTTATSTVTLAFPTKPANSKFIYQSTMRYQKFHITNAWPYWCDQYIGYEVRPTAFQGAVLGYNACCAPSTPYSQAINVVPVHVIKDQANAVNWSDGVKLAGKIGINLSAKSGYSEKTSIDFYFTSKGTLRGDDSRGYVYSTRITGG